MTNTYEDSWALVVGIDAYDDPKIKNLTGAVKDACAAVNWLRKAGVPDGHILLHAQPTHGSLPALKSLGGTVPWLDASESCIWESIARLRRSSGSHLFVFLLGHGLYEPTEKRLFITREASVGTVSNLGIEQHIELFRSMKFPEQLLVMDGCQNLPYSESVRSTIAAGMHNGVKGFNARKENTLIFCFACQQAERAVEIKGRGNFLKTLLGAIDTEHPLPQVLHLDFDKGEVSIDLRKAVTEIVGPEVKATAWNQQPPVLQQPGIEVYGAGTAHSVPPLHLPPSPAARLSIAVQPPSAVKAVKSILVQVKDEPFWRRAAPVPPSKAVVVPFENRLPHHTNLSVVCQLKNPERWLKPAERRVHIRDRDSEITFSLRSRKIPRRTAAGAKASPRGGGGSAIRTHYRSAAPAHKGLISWILVGSVDVHGNPAASVRLGTDHAETNLPISPKKIRMTETRGGFHLSARFDDQELLASFASTVASAVASSTPDDMSAVVLESSMPAETAVRIVFAKGGAERLAGPLADVPSVTVGAGAQRSLREMESEPFISVTAGYVPVTVELPWGSWSDVVEVFDGITKDVLLPETLRGGVVPLRATLPGDTWIHTPGYSVIGFDPRPKKAIIHGGQQRKAPSRAIPHSSNWLLEVQPAAPPWGIHASLPETGVTFPLHPFLPLALDVRDGVVRAEPLSTAPSAEWDDLMTLGRLRGHDPKSLLAEAKAWEIDPVLTLARAYACYAAGADSYTRRVLKLLKEQGSDIPDIAVLEGATRLRTEGAVSRPTRSALGNLADAGAVPILRWGIAPAILLAQKLGLDDWNVQLEAIEGSLSPVSVWAVWRT